MDNNQQYISVSDLNRYLNYKFEQDSALQIVYLKGEISNFKYSGKHCYFSLKDAFSEISATFFYPTNLSLNFTPVDGMSVQVIGKVQIYQKKGTYSINVSKMMQAGIGLLYQQFLELKDKLAKEGLFDPDTKLALPEYPERIAVITAPTGEAIRDIISTLNRRFPLAKIKLYPALVQGVDAPKDLIKALKKVYLDNDSDVIIIGRGGGSFEDLSCFNDEALARTLFASPIPTVSAVGHEGDYTICDFVASLRAPTPTGAAMLVSKDQKDIKNTILAASKRLSSAIKNVLTTSFKTWKALNDSYVLANFQQIIDNKGLIYQHLVEKLDHYNPKALSQTMEASLRELMIKLENNITQIYQNRLTNYDHLKTRLRPALITDKIVSLNDNILQLTNRIDLSYQHILDNEETNLNYYIDKMVILNPFNIMKKGYSIIYKDDVIISSTKNLHQNDEIMIKMADGEVDAIIKNLKTN